MTATESYNMAHHSDIPAVSHVIVAVAAAAAVQSNANDGVDFFSRTGTDHHFHYG
jgi:hypothetical protein